MSTSSRIITLLVTAALTASGLAGLASEPVGATDCDTRRAIVTDIDGTLTVGDDEWFRALFDVGYVEEARAGAADLMRTYASMGYWIVYVTGRTDATEPTGGSIREGTRTFLRQRGFPMDPERTFLFLSPDFASTLYPRGYKGSVVAALQDQGFEFVYAYGNSRTDIEAFLDTGLPAGSIFSVEDAAGYLGTNAIDDPDYVSHMLEHMPGVPDPCTPLQCPLVRYPGVLGWLLGDAIPALAGDPTPIRLPCR